MNTIRLNVPAGHKLSACTRDGMRYNGMSDVLAFRGNDQHYLAATNGHCAAVVPVEVGDSADIRLEQPMMLPAKAASTGAKPSVVEINGEVRRMEMKGTLIQKTEVFPLSKDESRFPPLGQVFPDPAELIENYTVLSIDAKLLADLAAALSPDSKLTLFIPPPKEKAGLTTGVVVAVGTNEGSPSGVGAIVPLSYGGDNRGINIMRTYLAEHVANMPKEMVVINPSK